jgi:hypothetical protein
MPLTIIDPSDRVTKLLHLAGLESAFDIELTEGKAVVVPNRTGQTSAAHDCARVVKEDVLPATGCS